MTRDNKSRSISGVQREIFTNQLILLVVFTLLLSVTGVVVDVRAEARKRDQNLRNVAEAIAHSAVLEGDGLAASLDTLKESLSSIDVISVIDADGTRRYHSNPEWIGTVYDGTVPDFSEDGGYTASFDLGPSGRQRRAYAAVYDDQGVYRGFVIAVTLMRSIERETLRLLLIYGAIFLIGAVMELIFSYHFSARIKKRLMGHEPDAFSAMYRIRDNILETLDEGVVAVDGGARIQFINRAAEDMLSGAGQPAESAGALLRETLASGEKEHGVAAAGLPGADILLDRIPIREGGSVVGAVGILHNRTEYTRLMEDLTGTRYLVDSMRANNHDFTNKLHVILGLLQMEMYDQAMAYIENITIVQRETISGIMNAVDNPSLAALLVGKTARASELNCAFVLQAGSRYRHEDMPLPSELLVTAVGNLIDNALEAMNAMAPADREKELSVGVFSRPGALLITVDDTGPGIAKENLDRIFENGFSTKGTGRGTGLYQVKRLVESHGGALTVESQEGVGASFAISFHRPDGEE